MREGFKAISDDTVNPPLNVAEGLFTVLITTPKDGYVDITVNEEGEIVKINGVNVKGRLFTI
jgi:hypothetical protein